MQGGGPTFALTIGGVDVAVPSSAYVDVWVEDLYCHLKINRNMESDTEFVLGAPFLNSTTVCLDYDQREVSILKMK